MRNLFAEIVDGFRALAAMRKQRAHDDYWDDIHGPGITYAEGEKCGCETCWCHEADE